MASSGTFGERLRDARKARGMTQKQLAAAIGAAQASVSDLEVGESKSPDGHTLVRSAKALRVRPEWLLYGTGPREGDGGGTEPAQTDLERRVLELLRSAGPEPRNSTEEKLIALIREAPLPLLDALLNACYAMVSAADADLVTRIKAKQRRSR